MKRRIPSAGWSLDEAIERVATSNDAHGELVACCASGSLIAYQRDQDEMLARLHPSDLANLLNETNQQRSDLKFFPIVESPDVLTIISGESIHDIFHEYILKDPEVAKLSIDALRVQPETERVLWGWWQANGVSEWPVNDGVLGAHDPDEKQSVIGFLLDERTPVEVRRFRAAIVSRFTTLLDLLRSGECRALGDPVRKKDKQEILPSIWSHRDFAFDATQGDLLQHNDGWDLKHSRSRYFKRWRAVTLVQATPSVQSQAFRPSVAISRVAQGELLMQPEAASTSKTGTDRSIVTKSSSRTACKRWLVSRMEISPNTKAGTKRDFWAEATLKWPGTLSWRSFEAAWNEAIVATEATAWSLSGRPRKSQQSKSPHQ